ncbi:MAG: DUF1275 domain-containing protein [Erythrobacter sp.]|uniref:DUF1275 family protein n=1 Tax=Erythrobacter sp. TaxID=1042 RepID=UPI0025E00053|nr:DUF1275 family protein [Erythrobacter sp.]MCL9998848.1 DUF1275 domain-containing protein [Erythrobacter sp.]
MTPAPASLSLRTPAPLVRLLLALTATTGMVDAASLVGMERVFAANVTGNLAFAALAVVGTPGFALLPCLAALAAFMAGAALAGRTGSSGARPGHWLVRAAVIESALLILAGLLALWLERAGALPGRAILGVIALTAGAAGFRIAVVRRLGVPGFCASLPVRPGALAMFLAGAAGGAALALTAGPGAGLLAAGGIVLAATALFVRHPQMSEIERP